MNRRKHLLWTSTAAVTLLLAAGLVTTALAQGSGSKHKAEKAEEKKIEVKAELNAEALKALTGAKVPMLLLDARGPSDQWLPGAVPLAYDADEKIVRRALTHTGRLVVTYCSGPECIMSLMLANHLTELGYPNVIRFTGGVQAWEEAGFPLQAEEKQSSATDGGAQRPRSSGSGTR